MAEEKRSGILIGRGGVRSIKSTKGGSWSQDARNTSRAHRGSGGGFEPLCQASEIGIVAAADPAKLGLLAALVPAKRAHCREQKKDDDDVV